MKSNYRRIGDFIKLVDVRNKDLRVTKLLGLSISKEFIPSVANTIGTNMAKYKIIKKNQFACSIMQVRRDKKMPIALLKEFDKAIISQAYPVFEVINTDELLPDYLMMWFSRSEFDRHACFLAVGGVRGSLEWEDFLDMELPVPSIEKQHEIVKEYNTIVNRISLNETLNQKLEETAQALYKHWFLDFEFPNAEGKSYKSSGGKMVFNKELDMEIPLGWEVSDLSKITKKVFSGGTPRTSEKNYWGNEFYWLSSGETRDIVIIDSERMITQNGVDNSSTKLALIGDTIIASAGQGKTRGQASFCGINTYVNQSVLCIRPKNESYKSFVFFHLRSKYNELRNESDAQSIRGSLNKDNISNLSILIPKEDVLKKYENIGTAILNKIILNRKISKELDDLASTILSKMSKVETKTVAVKAYEI
tara:strand:+ start:16091 stop:17350 length:1260 start_codon:yes stop_codon:yes gene_type:complete